MFRGNSDFCRENFFFNVYSCSSVPFFNKRPMDTPETWRSCWLHPCSAASRPGERKEATKYGSQIESAIKRQECV